MVDWRFISGPALGSARRGGLRPPAGRAPAPRGGAGSNAMVSCGAPPSLSGQWRSVSIFMSCDTFMSRNLFLTARYFVKLSALSIFSPAVGKSGSTCSRRMFPTVRISFRNIPDGGRYLVLLDIVPCDNKRYRSASHFILLTSHLHRISSASHLILLTSHPTHISSSSHLILITSHPTQLTSHPPHPSLVSHLILLTCLLSQVRLPPLQLAGGGKV